MPKRNSSRPTSHPRDVRRRTRVMGDVGPGIELAEEVL
jgi:hypothetical protein